jgi:hypothetical protein
MTIFILDNDLRKSVEYLDDKSLNKQIKTIAQILCDGHWEVYHSCELIGKNLWREWAKQCKANYLWLIEYAYESGRELFYRHEGKTKIHDKCYPVLEWARENVPDLPAYTKEQDNISRSLYPCNKAYKFNYGVSEYPLVMPNKYQSLANYNPENFNPSDHIDNIVYAYRSYYKAKYDKAMLKYLRENGMLVTWTRREKPEWLK